MKKMLLLVLVFLFIGCAKDEWREVKRGEVASVQYLQGGWAASDKTIITFKDGSIYMLYNYFIIPSKKIILLHNNNKWAGTFWKILEDE